MNGTKIQFSDAELTFMSDAEPILTKNRIIAKAKALLEELQQELVVQSQESFQQQKDLFAISPKVSKGENYLGLPYLILDFPRRFAVQDVFAIRSFFWWGNFFSSTLHLSGHYAEAAIEHIKKAYDGLSQQHYYIGVQPDPWMHHFEEDNYAAINTMDYEQFCALLSAQPHIKIAAKWPLYQWPSAANILLQSWKFLLETCVA